MAFILSFELFHVAASTETGLKLMTVKKATLVFLKVCFVALPASQRVTIPSGKHSYSGRIHCQTPTLERK